MKRANGTGFITKLSGNRRRPFMAGVTRGFDPETGRQIREPIGYFETKKLAREALDAFNQAPIERPRITLRELYDEWSAGHYPRISDSTKEGYECAWVKLEPIYDIKVRDLRVAQMQKIIDDNHELSKSYLIKIRVLLNMLMEYAAQHDIIHKNYAGFIVLPKKEKAERGVFSELEIQKLFDNDEDPWAQTILILIHTGFRVTEMLKLTRFNVDFKRNILTGGIKTEAGTNRAVPMHPKILPYIKAWYDRGGETLICAPKGGALGAANYRNRFYTPTLERLGIRPLTPHCCRHTCATRLAAVGVPPILIKQIMGHANYSTTANIYTHPDFDAMQDAIKRL